MTNHSPPADWRRQTGAGETTPPNIQLPSTSEGDMRKNAYRTSRHPRMFVQAVVNDDGEGLLDGTEKLLRELLEAVRALGEKLDGYNK